MWCRLSLIDVALDNRNAPVFPDVLSNQTFANAVVPHVPGVNLLPSCVLILALRLSALSKVDVQPKIKAE